MNHQQKLAQLQELWKKRVDDFHASGMKTSDFARAQNFSVHQFYYWKDKFKSTVKKDGPSTENRPPSFIKLKSTPAKASSHLPDPEWLAKLIRALT